LAVLNSRVVSGLLGIAANAANPHLRRKIRPLLPAVYDQAMIK
jgi:hypothetical protein